MKNKSGIKRKFFETLVILGITALIIVAIELILMVFFPQVLQSEKIIGQTFSVRDDVLGYKYTPSSKWRFTHPEYTVEYSINKEGFRDRKEHPIPKPEGTIRVLLIGDSFTFGQGVNYEQSWPVIVEKKLHELGNDHIDLVKAGIQGMDTRSEFILIQRLIDRFDCDVIVIGFLINDIYTNSLVGINGIEQNSLLETTNASKVFVTRQNQQTWANKLKNLFFKNDQQNSFHLVNFSKRLAIANPNIYCKLYMMAPNRRDWLATPMRSRSKKQLEITKILFEKISEYSKAHNKKLIVLSIPQQFQVLYFNESMNSDNIDVAMYDRYLEKIAKQNDFDWITTMGAFTGSKSNGEELFFRLDGHLTPEGNQVLADVFVHRILPLIK